MDTRRAGGHRQCCLPEFAHVWLSREHTTQHTTHNTTQHNTTHNTHTTHTTTTRPLHHTETETEEEDWPFFVDGVLFLVTPVCVRDLCLLNSVKNDCSLILSVHLGLSTVFLISANYLFYAVTVFIFWIIYLCSYSFEFFPNYLVMQLQFFFCRN